jgi:outer membrane lipoprotein-sorting protein
MLPRLGQQLSGRVGRPQALFSKCKHERQGAMSRMMRFYCALTLGALLMGGAARAADTIDDVEKKLIEATEKSKSLTAKVTSTTETEGNGMKMKLKMEGTTESARRGEKMYSRSEMTTKGTQKFGDQPEQKVDSKTLVIMDGEFLYSLNEDAGGQKSAVKMKIDPKMQKSVTKAMFEQLRKDNDVKLLPGEKIDGKDTYVLEAIPKKIEPNTTQKSTFWYDKESATLLKFVAENKNGDNKMTSTSLVSDVKLGVDIKPERFVFKAPEGVTVTDMTKMGQENAASETSDTTKTDTAKPAEESTAKKPEEKKPEEKKEEPKPEKKKLAIPKLKLK